jgi:hypothetical protein
MPSTTAPDSEAVVQGVDTPASISAIFPADLEVHLEMPDGPNPIGGQLIRGRCPGMDIGKEKLDN